jgi:hypothetical protein
MTQGLDSLVTFTDPFRTELADEIRSGEFVREDASADSIASFEDRNLPSRILEFVRCGKTGEPRAYYYSSALTSLTEHGRGERKSGRCGPDDL